MPPGQRRLLRPRNMTVDGWRRRARENLRASEILTDPELLKETKIEATPTFWNPAASRLYYALFEAVVAEFVRRKLTPKEINCPEPEWRHDCVASACVGTLQNRALGKAFKNAMALRERADYQPESPVTEQEFQAIQAQVTPELNYLGVFS